MKQPFEQKLLDRMCTLKKRIQRKIVYYTANGDQIKLRKYKREKWAIIGMYNHGFEFKTVLVVHAKFVRLDLVPTHYNYPEFYLF